MGRLLGQHGEQRVRAGPILIPTSVFFVFDVDVKNRRARFAALPAQIAAAFALAEGFFALPAEPNILEAGGRNCISSSSTRGRRKSHI